MKKRFLPLLLIILLTAGTVYAIGDLISTNRIFRSRVVPVDGSIYSTIIDMNDIKPEGFFSLDIWEFTRTGTGISKATISLEYLLSNKKNPKFADFHLPSTGGVSPGTIKSDHAWDAGPNSDGKAIYPFSPVMARWMLIKATQDSGISPVTISATIAIQ